MNKTEIKGRLKDIVEMANEVIETLKEKEDWLVEAVQKIDDLYTHLNMQITNVDGVFDCEELESQIKNQFFEDQLTEIYDLAYELQEDIGAYAEDLSESRQEKLLERYENLDAVIEMYSQDQSEYMELDDLLLYMNNSIELLKGMY